MSEALENLDSRLEAVRTQAELLLTDHDGLRILQDRLVKTVGGISLAFRASIDCSSTSFDEELGNLQYIYFSRPDSGNPVDYSINVNNLVRDRIVDGWFEDEAVMDEAYRQLANYSPEKRIVRNVLAAIQRINNDELPSDNLIHAIALDFSNFVNQGDELTHRYVSRPLTDGGILSVEAIDIKGDRERMRTFVGIEPALKVSVQAAGIDRQTSLEFGWDGLVETYDEIADSLERDAYYARPEDIERDEDGEIIFVSGNIHDIQAIIDAERAIGGRLLRPELLSVIEHGLAGR